MILFKGLENGYGNNLRRNQLKDESDLDFDPAQLALDQLGLHNKITDMTLSNNNRHTNNKQSYTVIDCTVTKCYLGLGQDHGMIRLIRYRLHLDHRIPSPDLIGNIWDQVTGLE